MSHADYSLTARTAAIGSLLWSPAVLSRVAPREAVPVRTVAGSGVVAFARTAAGSALARSVTAAWVDGTTPRSFVLAAGALVTDRD